ncbi:MAG: histidine triad nucleotide-binding protein [Lachnospiraceae bacterium]|nr:histidine triad nucleotide-binding protein [Lachnospiraceae bacterium]
MSASNCLKDDCLFCRIIKGEIPSTLVYQDDCTYAFRDINPQAPTHILVIPKNHIDSCADISEENSEWVAGCFVSIAKIAASEGLEKGFRVISNSGEDAGQTVKHLHFHILAGTKMDEGLI